MHSDLKSFLVMLYWKYKYVITFYDDFTSHAWTMPLRFKAAVITAAKDFLEMVHIQHNAQVVGWMSDAGRKYKSELFDRALLKRGIRTLMDKSESMCHQACIPDSWWEFAFAHTTHIYNHTLVARLKWCTPHEMFKGEMPIIDYLHIFGCGAFVYPPAMVPT